MLPFPFADDGYADLFDKLVEIAVIDIYREMTFFGLPGKQESIWLACYTHCMTVFLKNFVKTIMNRDIALHFIFCVAHD